MPTPDPISPFQRLRELCTRIPEGTQELLPIIDFLETFPEQVTEEALVHLVGVTALALASGTVGLITAGSASAATPPYEPDSGSIGSLVSMPALISRSAIDSGFS